MTLSEHLKTYGITSLWNVTHLSNLESLLSRGILCKNEVKEQSLSYTNISNRAVQGLRSPTFDANFRIIFDPYDYVPLFFADNTPMLYVTSHHHRRVILLELSPQIADTLGTVFSDANIASSHCRYSDPSDLRLLNWAIIRSRRGAYGDEWKRKRSAEVLILKLCPPSLIKAVHVQHAPLDNLVDETLAIIRALPDFSIDVYQDLTPEGVS